jgi:HSP20 family molecular chaperone IbpA
VPGGLNPDAIQASLRHGVLSLRIPKPEELKPRRIQVREAGRPQQIEGATA